MTTRTDLPGGFHGFPDLRPDLDRLEIEELPPRASPMQLAQFYGTIVAAWRGLWPRFVGALEWLHHAVLALDGSIGIRHDQTITEIRELREALVRAGQMRRRLPSLTELEPEITANGHVRLAPEAFEAIQQRIADLEAKTAKSDEAEKLEKARAEGAEAALAAYREVQEKRSARFFRWAPLVISALALLGGGAGWLLHHLTTPAPAPTPIPVPVIVQPH